MFFCHHRSVHFPVGLFSDKKRASAKSMKTASLCAALVLEEQDHFVTCFGSFNR